MKDEYKYLMIKPNKIINTKFKRKIKNIQK